MTAVSGKLGSEIVKALSTIVPQQQIIGLARTPENAKNLGIEIRPGDYNHKSTLEKSLQSVDILLLVSGMDDPKTRIKQHRNVIDAAKCAGVRKIVYTSVQGAEENTAFSSVVQSNRQTELDIMNSGLDWVIGRNGIYIEPDIEYVDTYKKLGGIFNCAGEGKCAYATRPELAFAYAKMLSEDKHNGHIYNLQGEAISQYQLAGYLNDTFKLDLEYTPMTFEAYRQERIVELGEFIGTVIAGIYQGIQLGEVNNPSHFLQAAGREHQSWQDYFSNLKTEA